MNKKKSEKHTKHKKTSGIAEKQKAKLHPRSKHRERYDFKALIESSPELADFVKANVYGNESIDFSDPKAVKSLNKALLKYFYGIDSWDIPENYLCPPIPGRADYIHYIADLLQSSNYGKLPPGEKIRGLDIGVGANCIYPILGTTEYNWSFIGSDIDSLALDAARNIIEANPSLQNKVDLKLQPNPKDYFYGIIQKTDRFDFSICNPPFHASEEEAQSGTRRKLKNLSRKKPAELIKNFGGQNTELWCEGGEKRFVTKMIRESKKFSAAVFWFTSIISKQSNLKSVTESLKQYDATTVKVIPMGQGNKSSRIIAWTFLSPVEQKQWKEQRWSN